MSPPTPSPEIRVAVTQAEPIWLDLDETVLKTIKLIIEAAAHGAQLITFPECWIPGYPAWIWSRPVDFDLTTLYTKSSMAVDSPHMRTLCDSARCNNIAVALGFSENYNNSLYIAQALISANGKLAMTRRKLKPTHMERTIFGEGTGNSLHNVVDVNGVGKVGQLACWEHAQPLLKYHTCMQNEDVHVSAWPPVYEHRGGRGLWSMSRDGCRNLSQTHAIESQSFVLHTTSVITQPGIDRLQTSETSLFGVPGGGSSAIFGPDGRQLSEDIPETMEGILYADLDFDEILRAKGFLDVCGHGSRSDMLWLGVDDREKAPLKRHRTGEDFGGGTLTGGSPPPKPCDKPLVFSWMNQT
ncbi:carbon-nitrogen hydrolase [Amylocarpus encephaloides]|uniref:nitrilase n=1 Tax=Amylocarpus encephaloides TaxID=45428 RepID=A0A9P7YGM1_9HELO|nr:carbon-nitrogen hydrolase [Amylocarpus encephaloides]